MRARSHVVSKRRSIFTQKVGTEHLLCCQGGRGIAAEALRSLDISPTMTSWILSKRSDHGSRAQWETEAAKLAFTPLVISVMERSFRVARENNQTYVSSQCAVGIVEGSSMAMDILGALGVSSASHQKKAIETHRQGPGQEASARRAPVLVVPARSLPFFSGSDASLSKSGTDTPNSSRPTSRRRRATASSTLWWSRKEVQRMMEILSRRTKNNPLPGRPRRGQDGHRRGLAADRCRQ